MCIKFFEYLLRFVSKVADIRYPVLFIAFYKSTKVLLLFWGVISTISPSLFAIDYMNCIVQE